MSMVAAENLLAPPRPLVTGASAWIGSALAQRPDEWTHHLTSAELAEIAAATAAVSARGLPIAGIGRADFPLPSLGPTLDRLRREVIEGRGFVLLRGLPVAGRPIEEVATAYWGIGSHFGKACSQNRLGHLLGHVRSQGLSTRDGHVRAYQTTERQTFHVDSCDIVGLLCLQTARRGGVSALVSSMTVYNRMATERPDLARRLFLPVASDRRDEVPEGAKPYVEIPVFNDYAGLLTVFYVKPYIEAAQQRFPDAPRLTAADIEALDYFDVLVNDRSLWLEMALEPGDMQFLHNHTVLHDRTAYEEWPEPERKRHLLRLWLTPPDGRPLPPCFAQRYGSVTIGDRGGIICRDTRPHVTLAVG